MDGTTTSPGQRPASAGSCETSALNATAEIKVHLGETGSAVMRFSESRHAFSLDLILVPSAYRGGGLGTALILRLLAIADAVGKPVHTTARPIGHSSPEILDRLVTYYERFGFVPVEQGYRAVHMKRPARSATVGP